jgi:hypothetical protein
VSAGILFSFYVSSNEIPTSKPARGAFAFAATRFIAVNLVSDEWRRMNVEWAGRENTKCRELLAKGEGAIGTLQDDDSGDKVLWHFFFFYLFRLPIERPSLGARLW